MNFKLFYKTGKAAIGCFGLAALAFLLLSQSGRAQDVFVPNFFAPQERFERPDISTIQRLRFVTTVDFPPFNFIDRTGHLSGYNIDLMRAICIELKIENRCQIEAVPWDELEKRVKSGDAEAIIAGFSPTRENRKILDFTRPYMRFPARFMGLRSVIYREPFGVQLDGHEVGVLRNTTHANMLTGYFPTVKAKLFDNYDALYAALKEGQIDMVFGDGMNFSLWLRIPENSNCCKFVGGPYVGPGYLGSGMRIAVSEKNPGLVRALNYAMLSLEQKGKLTELYLRYFPVGFY